ALEGSVFVAGAAVQWLRDGLKLFEAAPAVEALAEQSDPEQPVLFVPGFVGLGAPHWVPEARGVLFGLTRGTTAADVSRATLEGVAFQVADLIDAAANDAGKRLHALRVDGGMARNEWFLRCQADVRGLAAGVWPDVEALRKLGGGAKVFQPRWPAELRRGRLEAWRRAVRAVIAYYRGS